MTYLFGENSRGGLKPPLEFSKAIAIKALKSLLRNCPLCY